MRRMAQTIDLRPALLTVHGDQERSPLLVIADLCVAVLPVPHFVIAGLDPAIHEAVPFTRSKWICLMDARVKPGHDE